MSKHVCLQVTQVQVGQISRKANKKTKRRPASPKERLLEAATHLFCRYGINSIGVDAIVAEAGTAKATLYNTFGSKEALACEVLDREGQRWREWLFEGLDAFDGDPVSRLLHIFTLLENWFAGRQYYGCPFINAVAENDKLDDKLRNIAIGHKTIVLERITDMARLAQLPDPERTAHEFAVIIDGSIIAALIMKDPALASVARNAAAAVIGASLETSAKINSAHTIAV